MLTLKERDQVIEELADHVGVGGSIAPLIPIIFPLTARKELPAFPLDLNSTGDQAVWLVDSCLASRWRVDPSLMELLLRRLVITGGKGALHPLLDRVKIKDNDPNPDPYRSLWVLSDQPFLDRDILRKAAKQLIEEIDRPILRVNGPKKSGKSYSVELLSYIAQKSRPDIHVVPVELADGTGLSYEVEELAESLVVSMEKAEALPARSNSSYPPALCRWLIRNANKNPGLWIFVLDGFGQELKSEVSEFILKMAEQIAIPEFARKMRLVLLHFEQPLIGNWRAKTVDDGLKLSGIKQEDLEACLVEFNRRMAELGKNTKMVETAGIPKLAAGMLSRSGANGSPLLPGLYEELLALAI